MGWNQLQLDSRKLPEKTRPDEQPEVPGDQNEWKYRNADVAIPQSAQSWLQFSVVTDGGVPRRGMHDHMGCPDRHDKNVDNKNQNNFCNERIAQSKSRDDGFFNLAS